MTPKRVPFDHPDAILGGAGRAAEHLRQGGILAYPTETTYGLGCTLDAESLGWLARAKERGPDQPFLLLVRSAADAPGLTWNDVARALARAFWPGPLTLALPDPERRYPQEVRSRRGAVAIRSSPHPGVRAVLQAIQAPIVSTSANMPGGGGARSADAALTTVAALVDDAAPPVMLLDGGALPPSEPSTIVLCDSGGPRLLRAGAVALDDIARVVHGIQI